jgi:hypothetical protein
MDQRIESIYEDLAAELTDVRERLASAEEQLRLLRQDESKLETEILHLGDIAERLSPRQAASPTDNVVPIRSEIGQAAASADWSELARSTAVLVVLTTSKSPLTRHEIRERLRDRLRDDHPADISAALSYLRRTRRAVPVDRNHWRAVPPDNASAVR